MREDNDKRKRKRRDCKGIAKRCLAALLALLLTAQGTAFTSVYAADDTKTEEKKTEKEKEEEKTKTASQKAAEGADDLEYEFPEKIEVENQDGTTTTYWDIYGGSDGKAVTASSRGENYKNEKELVKDILLTTPSSNSDYDGSYSTVGQHYHEKPTILYCWAEEASRMFNQQYGDQKMYIPYGSKKKVNNVTVDYSEYINCFRLPDMEDYNSVYNTDLLGKDYYYVASQNFSDIKKHFNGYAKDTFPYYAVLEYHLIEGVPEETEGSSTKGVYYGRSGSIYGLPKNADKTNAWATGLQMGNSLADAGNAMYDVVTTYLSPKLTPAELRKYSDIPLLGSDQTDKQVVAYSFVGTSERRSSGKFDYNCFGFVFYDFELVPIVETKEEDYGTNLIYTKGTVNALDALSKGTAMHADGLDYTPVSNGGKGETTVDRASFDNSDNGGTITGAINYSDSSTESTTKNESQSENSSTTSNQSETFTYTHTSQKKGRLKGATRTNAFSAGETLGFSETWGTAYTEGKSSTSSSTVSEGASANATVNPYSILSISQNKASSSLTLQYQQPCVISYKVAMVSIAGTYDNNTHPENYPQLQFCTIFGNVDQDGKEDDTGDDAIDRLKKRIDAMDENNGNGIENQCYTRATRYNPGQKVGESDPEVLSKKTNFIETNEESRTGRNYTYTSPKTLNNYLHLMSTHGGAMSASADSITYRMSQIVAKPFRVIDAKLKDDSNSTDLYLYKGETSVGLNAKLSAYFSGGKTEWPGFKDTAKSGSWYIVDRHGNNIAETNEYDEQTTDNITLAQIDNGKWVLDCNAGTKDGTTVYLQYKFNDGYYSYYDKSKGKDMPITLEDYKADEGKLPMITVHCYMTSAQAQRAKRLNASMFAGDGAGGWIAVVVVVVLVLAGGIFVLYRKRKRA